MSIGWKLSIWHAIYQFEIVFPAINTPFIWESDALMLAERWLIDNPDDIVMVTEVAFDVCKNCGEVIHERAGWIVHQWVHLSNGAYTCALVSLPQAEPRRSV